MKLPIYLDNHATTPMDPRVFEAMRPYFMERFGNASSSHHAFGWEAEAAVKLARAEVASLVGASPEEIFFTSGVTEANHWVLHGVAESYRDKGSLNQANHIITCATEHRSILAPCQHLESLGYRVTYLPVDARGLVDLQGLERSLTPDTILVSIMAAHNEVGTLAPLEEIGRLVRSKGVLFHTDAAQACGKIPIDVRKMGIDLMSISAHKMYGPKGIGALYVRRHHGQSAQPHVRLAPLLRGGGQERGWRAGTLNVPAIVGLGKACEVVDLQKEMDRIGRLRDKLYAGLVAGLDRANGPSIVLNGHPTRRLPGNLNVSFLGVPSDALMGALPDIAVSSGSACSSESAEPSYVLRAMGVGDERARSSIRFGLGRFTTEEEIDFTLRQVVAKVASLSF